MEPPGYRNGRIRYLAPRESTQKVGQSLGRGIQSVLQINTIKKNKIEGGVFYKINRFKSLKTNINLWYHLIPDFTHNKKASSGEGEHSSYTKKC